MDRRIKEIEYSKKFALSKYKTDSILTADEIGKLEEVRVDYKTIRKRLTKKAF